MENAFGQPQNVVVLGGTSDIARAIVTRLAKVRARTVVLAGRDQSRLDEAAKEARDSGATSTPTVIFDAEDPSDAGRCVANCFDAVGAPVDLVIIAVGLLGDQLTDENDPIASARMMNVNLTWPVAALAEVRRRLCAQGSGRILVITSIAGVRVRRANYLYSGAKAGLDRLCEGVADSLIGTGVSIQVLRPAFVHSKMTAGRRATPFSTGVDEVADTAVAGLSSERRVIYSPPVLRYVFAILRHLPAPLWRKLNEDR